MNARLAMVSMSGYTRHELTRTNLGIVREFANGDGQVFAVTWSGPGKPDLRTLLGTYFPVIEGSKSTIGRNTHSLRRPVQIDQADLHIQSQGHMGWFHGVALIPSLAPANFAASDLVRE